MFVFGPSSTFRRLATKVAAHRFFEWLIWAFILLSSACLAINTPGLDPGGTIFKVEMLFDMFLAQRVAASYGTLVSETWHLIIAPTYKH